MSEWHGEQQNECQPEEIDGWQATLLESLNECLEEEKQDEGKKRLERKKGQLVRQLVRQVVRPHAKRDKNERRGGPASTSSLSFARASVRLGLWGDATCSTTGEGSSERMEATRGERMQGDAIGDQSSERKASESKESEGIEMEGDMDDMGEEKSDGEE